MLPSKHLSHDISANMLVKQAKLALFNHDHETVARLLDKLAARLGQ